MLDEAGWEKPAPSSALQLPGRDPQSGTCSSRGQDRSFAWASAYHRRSEPVFGGVYKLTAVEEADGSNHSQGSRSARYVAKITPPLKSSSASTADDTAKAIAGLPHHPRRDRGRFSVPHHLSTPRPLERRKEVYDFTAKELQVARLQAGSWSNDLPSLPSHPGLLPGGRWTPSGRGQALRQPPTSTNVDLSRSSGMSKHNLLEDNGAAGRGGRRILMEFRVISCRPSQAAPGLVRDFRFSGEPPGEVQRTTSPHHPSPRDSFCPGTSCAMRREEKRQSGFLPSARGMTPAI